MSPRITALAASIAFATCLAVGAGPASASPITSGNNVTTSADSHVDGY